MLFRLALLAGLLAHLAACPDGDGDRVDGGVLATDAGVPDAGPPPACGDFVVEGGELCDDGNRVDGDGCTASCRTELCANGLSVLTSPRRRALPHGSTEAVAIADFNGDGANDIASISSNVLQVGLAGPLGFSPVFQSSTGLGESLAALDLNGDDKIDLVVVDEDTGIYGLLNDGSGGFAAFHAFDVAASGGEQVAVADIDVDGRADIIVAHGRLADADNGGIRLLFGEAPLTFSDELFATGAAPESFVVVDVDADGDLDLAVANEAGGDVVILFNNGGRRIAPGPAVLVGPNPQGIVAGDFDDDGDADLAVAAASGIDLLENDGRGGFTRRDTVDRETAWFAIVAADFDGDGFVDLAAAAQDEPANEVSLYRRTGAFAFARVGLTFASSRAPRALAAGDLDGDCQVDLVVGMRVGAAQIIDTACGNRRVDASEGCDDGNDVDGDGCDADCTVSACGNGIVAGEEECDNGVGDVVPAEPCDVNCTFPRCGNGVVFQELCDDGNDLDGDGCDSNCTPTACGNGIVTTGEVCDDRDVLDGDGCDGNCTPTACGNGVVTEGEFCDDDNDVDGDGCDVDCRLSSCDNAIAESGELCVSPVSVIAERPSTFGLAVVGDVNDDGFDDFAVVDGETIAVFGSSGDGDWNTPTILGPTGAPRFIDVADIDLDGDLDLITTEEAAEAHDLGVFANDGSGGFAARIPTAVDLDVDGDVAFSVGEFDQDPGPDIVILGSAPAFYGNDGTGSFSGPRPLGLGLFACESLLVADIEFDGDNDIVANCGGSLAAVVNDGSAGFSVDFGSSEVNTATPLGCRPVAGDVDGDNDVDVLACGRGFAPRQFLGDGAGDFVSSPMSGVSPLQNLRGRALVDVDGDGVLDVALAERDVRFLRGDGTGAFVLLDGSLPMAGDQLLLIDGAGPAGLLGVNADRIDVVRFAP